jgi:ribosomal protein L16 Arg81 hydroxylase
MLNFTSGSFIDDTTVENANSIRLIEQELGPDSLGTIDAYEVVAGPGNVLYLPPLWFHRVITEDKSIAISTSIIKRNFPG